MLGQDLAKIFSADKSYEVISWDVEEINITDRDQVFKKIEDEKPEIIINAAAYNAVDKAEEDEKEFELAKKVNGEGPKNLAEIAKKIDAIFVHYVSDYIFDGEVGDYSEEDVPSPISRYGESKALGENNVKRVGGNFYILRTSKLFGKPAQSESAKKSFFEVMLDLAQEKDEIKVVDSERSCFTYTPDLAQATKELIEQNYDFGIYHIINEGAVTWYEGVLELFKKASIKNVKVVPVGSEEFPRPAKRPKSSVLKNTKFPKLKHYGEALEEWLK